MNYFEKTQKLMLMVEQIVIETKFHAPERVAAVLHQFLFGPVGFLLLGLRAIFTSLTLWAVGLCSGMEQSISERTKNPHSPGKPEGV